MADEILIDCMGMKCPRPIIELAKAARKAASGAKVRIRADDLAFESDVRAWCDATGATLVDLESSGVSIQAVIRLKD